MDPATVALVVGGAILVIVALGVLIFFWMSLPGFWAVLKSTSQDKDLVDPDAEIMPSQERHSSEVLKDRAYQVKADILPPGHVIPQPLPPQPIPQQAIQQLVEPLPQQMPVQPVVQPLPPQPLTQQMPQQVVHQVPPQQLPVPPLPEQAPLIPNTIVPPPVAGPAPMMPNSNMPPVPAPTSNPSMQTEIYQAPQELVQRPAILDAQQPIVQTPPAPIEGEVPTTMPPVGTDDNSKYAVRDSSNPPGRMIRDGRYNRNASGS